MISTQIFKGVPKSRQKPLSVCEEGGKLSFSRIKLLLHNRSYQFESLLIVSTYGTEGNLHGESICRRTTTTVPILIMCCHNLCMYGYAKPVSEEDLVFHKLHDESDMGTNVRISGELATFVGPVEEYA